MGEAGRDIQLKPEKKRNLHLSRLKSIRTKGSHSSKSFRAYVLLIGFPSSV